MDQKKYEFSQNIAVFRTMKLMDIDCDEVKNSEFSFLIVIYNLKKKVNSVELSKYFNCSKVYVSKIIGSLIEKKYIEKEVFETDRRAYDLKLTEKGVDFVSKYMDKYIEITSYLYDKMGEEKASQLDLLLTEANTILKNRKKQGEK